MEKNLSNVIVITEQTESGIQIVKKKIIIPKATVSATNSRIIIPSSSLELMNMKAGTIKDVFGGIDRNKLVIEIIK